MVSRETTDPIIYGDTARNIVYVVKNILQYIVGSIIAFFVSMTILILALYIFTT